MAAVTINKLSRYLNISPYSTSKHKVFCSRVIDGDTIVVKSGGKKWRVRLIGIDTPEINWKNKELSSRGAFEALYFLKNEIENKSVFIEAEEPFVGHFGRVLAYVFKDGVLLNASIVQKGYGKVFRRYPCNKTNELLRLEALAKRNGLGIWK